MKTQSWPVVPSQPVCNDNSGCSMRVCVSRKVLLANPDWGWISTHLQRQMGQRLGFV